MQGVDGVQKATQAISHADMRRMTTVRPAIECRRNAVRAAAGAVAAAAATTSAAAPVTESAATAAAAAYGTRLLWRLSVDGDGGGRGRGR